MNAPRRRVSPMALFALVPLLPLFVIGWVLVNAQGGIGVLSAPRDGETSIASDAATLQRGEYLARLGNCATCHTTRGGAELAGGRAFSTDYGTIHSTNLTPDAATGIGEWSVQEFGHAMRHGVSRHGLLYPVFPFQNFQHLTDADVDAIFAWLRSRPAIAQATPANTLAFPASSRAMVLGWRMLFHRPQPLVEDVSRSAQWNRGRYLVEGLGHCDMCHGERAEFGSLPSDRRNAGGTIPGLGWRAPPLDQDALSRWSQDELAYYLRAGTGKHGSAYGPMAEVIASSLQYLEPADAQAMAAYLQSLPPARIHRVPVRQPQASASVGPASIALYERHCADCHGSKGEGGERAPPLAGNPQVTAEDPVNPIRVVLYGAAAPATRAEPAPHSMPPFVDRISDADIALLLNHIRGSFGNQAAAVSREQLSAARTLPLE